MIGMVKRPYSLTALRRDLNAIHSHRRFKDMKEQIELMIQGVNETLDFIISEIGKDSDVKIHKENLISNLRRLNEKTNQNQNK